MSQLVAPSHTALDSIPLGRRIAEMMKEKGAAYTIASMSNKIGMCRETFRLMLKGGREIYTFELEKVAGHLKITLERILQTDIREDGMELNQLFVSLSDKRRTLELAEKLYAIATGDSERCIAANNVGRAHYLLRNYEEAHQIWLEAYDRALRINEKHGDAGLLLRITTNLMLSYSIRKDYSNLVRIASNAEPVLDANPKLAADICYSLAKVNERDGNYRAASSNYYRSLAYYQQTEHVISIAKAKHNVGAFEYRRGNFEKSKELFEEAIEEFGKTQDLYGTVLCMKEFIKALIRTGCHEKAEKLISEAMEQIKLCDNEDFSKLNSQLILLHAILQNDPLFANKLLLEDHVPRGIRKVAGRFLMKYYSDVGDTVALAKYHKVVNELLFDQYDILDEVAL